MPIVHLIAGAIAPALTAVEPSGKWEVTYAVHQCTAQREFATAEGPVSLFLKPSPVSDVVQINLVANGSGRIATESEVKLTFDGVPTALRELSFSSGKLTIRQINLPGEYAGKLERAKSIGWAIRGVNLQFNIGSLTRLMKELKACKENLRDYWHIGLNEPREAEFSPKPIKPIISLFESGDYPRQSIRQDETGMTSIVVLVDEKGLVRDCMLDATSGLALLDAMTCAVVTKRGKFKPAIGADGMPMRSYFTQRVRWEIP